MLTNKKNKRNGEKKIFVKIYNLLFIIILLLKCDVNSQILDLEAAIEETVVMYL